MTENIERLEDYGLSKDNKPKTLFSRVGIVGAGSVGQNIAQNGKFQRTGCDIFLISPRKKLIRLLLNWQRNLTG